MTEKRVKTGLALKPSILGQCDANLNLAGASPRNDFVERAVSFYAGYLNAGQNRIFLKICLLPVHSSGWWKSATN